MRDIIEGSLRCLGPLNSPISMATQLSQTFQPRMRGYGVSLIINVLPDGGRRSLGLCAKLHSRSSLLKVYTTLGIVPSHSAIAARSISRRAMRARQVCISSSKGRMTGGKKRCWGSGVVHLGDRMFLEQVESRKCTTRVQSDANVFLRESCSRW
ncbi:hypothetical protein CYLTODRAFT_142854 [Cylindrobasidium torrendii FP15055 ss-10]|uniref:Uncharacterized protein n=1 Tax=Cylindrobasidium torrendii FP15055 ss-10 TaxID=1314674 RepID=A0A0D7AZ74_9AGAR|nr:hypothetical protein CYLTODRAFT_142854 [Cylindrobasidium torrendii FP15055 ss-10]